VDNYLAWYQQFETIHPFIDGNGRVGGVVIAVLSFNVNGVFTVPDGC
jgi:fido (protein-threonine AMPylation protein)